jgi:HK97 gp10 family phage protein
MSEIGLKGGKELAAFLESLPAKMERNIMRGALRVGAKIIHEEAARLLDSNGSVKTGELKRGLKVGGKAKGGVVTAYVRTRGKHSFVANWVEFGTAAHWIKPKKSRSLFFAGLFAEVIHHPGARPKPFMRPAADTQAAAAVAAVADYIKRRLTKAGLENASEIEVEVDR